MSKAKLKLYRHYKNKPYKYLGMAHHSETLEELVLYETRYSNDLGPLWVRPKEIFFSETMVDGQSRPRFEQVSFEISEAESLSPEDREEILLLMSDVFGESSGEYLDGVLLQKKSLLLLCARDSSLDSARLAGFKLGYARTDQRFYSWLGAVGDDYCGIGLGQELMQRQQQWCLKKGFKVIETRTKNKWRQMLLLNIKNGFDVVGTYTDSEGEAKVILEKRLSGSST